MWAGAGGVRRGAGEVGDNSEFSIHKSCIDHDLEYLILIVYAWRSMRVYMVQARCSGREKRGERTDRGRGGSSSLPHLKLGAHKRTALAGFHVQEFHHTPRSPVNFDTHAVSNVVTRNTIGADVPRAGTRYLHGPRHHG